MNCLVDADALIALSKENDSNHKLAAETLKLLEESNINLVLSIFTIAEAVTAISRKVGQREAKELLIKAKQQKLPEIELKIKKRADEWFIKQESAKCVSYFDCYNMALLEEYNKSTPIIFSFDKIYEKNGFKLASGML